MKAGSTVNRWAREMMAISRHSNDPVESRVAWTVAHWLRRVTEDTKGWPVAWPTWTKARSTRRSRPIRPRGSSDGRKNEDARCVRFRV